MVTGLIYSTKTCVHMCIYICMRVYTCSGHAHVYMHAYMYVRMHVCVSHTQNLHAFDVRLGLRNDFGGFQWAFQGYAFGASKAWPLELRKVSFQLRGASDLVTR